MPRWIVIGKEIYFYELKVADYQKKVKFLALKSLTSKICNKHSALDIKFDSQFEFWGTFVTHQVGNHNLTQIRKNSNLKVNI